MTLSYSRHAYEEMASKNVDFALALLGNGSDRGDFIGVEKNGYSAGHWKADLGIDRYYWGDTQNANWLCWCEVLGQGVGLPLFWAGRYPSAIWTCPMPARRVPIDLGGTETGNCAYEDTFFPYFFENVKRFIAAGFICFLVGKGPEADERLHLLARLRPKAHSRGDAGPDGRVDVQRQGFFQHRMTKGASMRKK